MKKGIAIVTFVFLLVFAFTAVSYAGNGSSGEAGPMTKLGTGLNNLLTGWVSIPVQIREVTLDVDPIAGLAYGGAKGLGLAFGRTIVGIFDIVTFAFEPYDEPIMEPVYRWGGDTR